YFVVDGKAYKSPTSDPSQRTPLAALGQSVQRLSVSGDGHVIAFYEGTGVFVSIDEKAPSPVAAGAFDPAVAPDGSAVAVKTNSSAVQVFTTANPATMLSSAPRLADGAFDAPVVANGGRQVVFVAQRGAAAGGSGTNDQIYALGPGL